MSLMSPLPLTVCFSGWVKDPDETGHNLKKCCNPWILDKWLEFCWHTIHPLFALTSSTPFKGPLSWCMYGWPLPLAVAGWQLLNQCWWAGCWVCWAPHRQCPVALETAAWPCWYNHLLQWCSQCAGNRTKLELQACAPHISTQLKSVAPFFLGSSNGEAQQES